MELTLANRNEAIKTRDFNPLNDHLLVCFSLQQNPIKPAVMCHINVHATCQLATGHCSKKG